MEFIFIRHGETDNTRDRIFAPDPDTLNARGREQAELLAKRLKDFKLDFLVASPVQRAKETAEVISKETGITVLSQDFLREKKIASSFLLKPFIDPDVREVRKVIAENNRNNPAWHYEDEENFVDIKKRAQEAIEYLKNLGKERICVVSHSTFIKVLTLTLLFEDHLTYDIYYRFLHATNIKPTGLVIFEHRQSAQPGGAHHWHLVEWNNHNHLPIE